MGYQHLTLAWVTLLAVLSLSSFLKRHFGWGFIYGLLALFCLNGQYHFLSGVQFGGYPFFNTSSDRSQYFIQPSKKIKERFGYYSTGSMSRADGNNIDVTFSTVTKYLNDKHFTHGSAEGVWAKHRFILTTAALKGRLPSLLSMFPLGVWASMYQAIGEFMSM